jgi:hypothetical protein
VHTEQNTSEPATVKPDSGSGFTITAASKRIAARERCVGGCRSDATALRLLGVDHTKLSVYNNGIQRWLTDVHGHVIESIFR